MSKLYTSKKDALNDLDSLGNGEVIQILGEFFKVGFTLLGRNLRKVNPDSSFYQEIKQVDRVFSSGTKNSSCCKSAVKESE